MVRHSDPNGLSMERIHIIGDRFKGPLERTGLHEVYDPASGKWMSAAPMPTPRSGLASAYYRGMIPVLGGELPPDHTFPDNEGYDPKTTAGRRWRRCCTAGTALAAPRSATMPTSSAGAQSRRVAA